MSWSIGHIPIATLNMNVTKPKTNNPFTSAFDDPEPKEDWEDWEEDEVPTRAGHGESLLIDLDDDATEKLNTTIPKRGSVRRYSVQKPSRLKSKGRQKAQNAKAGIKVVTDMSKLRHGDKNAQRFADEDALKALEGSPSAASVGSFHWLKRKPGNVRSKSLKKTIQPEADLSPDSRTIAIGIAVPSDHLPDYQVSPQTAVLETPLDINKFPQPPTSRNLTGFVPTVQQQQSVWSPDTEDGESLSGGTRPTSSIYSQSTGYGANISSGNVPPVPSLPATTKFKQSKLAAHVESDDEDVGTPCTLFEEDGSPVASRTLKPKAAPMSPASNGPRPSGWWDHVTIPVSQQSTNPFQQQPQTIVSSTTAAPEEWWKGIDEKKPLPSSATGLTVYTAAVPQPTFSQAPVAANATASSSQRRNASTHPETQSEKARILLEENQNDVDEPPPYSPPKTVNKVKYGAILPQSYHVNTEPIPSPGPISPGLSRTMTSQGAINLAEIPHTPRTVPAAVLPDRPAGSYVPEDHFHEAAGTRHKVERRRRRHEKEDVMARKVGEFWRGRAFIPDDGCFGRTGREGRKRRRICLGIFAGFVAIIILVVVLAVVLTRRSLSKPLPEYSVWLNLTDFPPMPTGVLTVAGPDNSEAVSGCLEDNAQTAWSCSIPKDQQVPDSPYAAEQPEFIFQIQYDNNTRQLWKIESDDNVAPANQQSEFREIARRDDDEGFSPNPQRPPLAEMSFLGNTTDGIISGRKQGEPTPFYISVIPSIEDTVGPNMVMRRDVGNGIGSGDSNGTTGGNVTEILPYPELNPDGTGAPARLYPFVTQQPVRLFDRGLPTEHYGFYTYFNKTVYLTDMEKRVSSDEDGGALLQHAKFLMTWTQTRFVVKIWTRTENATQLLGNDTTPGTDGSTVLAQPGTMPWPVTITEDIHGGNANNKATFYWGVTGQQRINVTEGKLITVNPKFGGTLVNPRDKADLALGGIDGGTGGCKCQWVNFNTKK